MSGEFVHRLGMAGAVVPAVGWGLRRLEIARRRRRVRRRVADLLGLEAPSPGAAFAVPDRLRRCLPLVGAAGGAWVLVGGVTGVLLGLVVGAVLWRWRERRTSAGRAQEIDTTGSARQLPLAADLLAACIAAGAGPVVAAQAVGEALGGPVGEALARGAAEVRLGGEPGHSWRRLAALPGAMALARLLERADETGLPAAGPVARLASDARADWARAATVRARRAAVLISAPVGLCFLPAFIAIGVVPVVIGLAGGVMGGR
ncbi:Pilus assembly protein TadC [Streptomyces sp. 1222.5]|uniref:type II secretion system F family protein n=1 Tax=unclassified Streptomyces TaxID=2593676 RepID=UPI00089CBAEA|nr:MULTISPECIES: type II secretion system F family protein [unclassified Streptomyces]PKW08581.1 pilus assembly protein TadC [Streptomyces sp. 5112.2]SEC59279.1 Pilus assembly protein TadC [Streptomyces sp. 1222.5]